MTFTQSTSNIKSLMSNEEKKNDWQERELGALWAKKSNSGSQYMTGHITMKGTSEKVPLVVFRNKNKYNEDGSVKNENAPDLRVYLSEMKEQGSGNRSAAPAAKKQQNDEALF